MSLSFSEMRVLAEEIASVLIGTFMVKCRAISPWSIFLTLKHPEGHLFRLLISLQEPFLRFHLFTGNAEEIDTPFSRELDHHLQNARIERIGLAGDDRILEIAFIKKETFRLIAELFPKRPQAYLVDSENGILSSLHAAPQRLYELPLKKGVIPKDQNTVAIASSAIEEKYGLLEQQAHFHREKKKLQELFRKRLKRSEAKKTEMENYLQKCCGWEAVYHEGLLLQTNYHLLKPRLEIIEVDDWVSGERVAVELDPKLSPSEQLAARFKASKKLQAGIPHAEVQIKRIDQEIEAIQEAINALEPIDNLEGLEAFKRENRVEQKGKTDVERKAAFPFREFITKQGLKIWVGKSAKDNDVLTFQYARGSDWWLHVNDYPGAHVILKVEKNKDPDAESLQDALQVALHHSKAKDKGEAEVCVTQRKYVSRFGKGKAGKVTISKHQMHVVRKDEKRWKAIREGISTL